MLFDEGILQSLSETRVAGGHRPLLPDDPEPLFKFLSTRLFLNRSVAFLLFAFWVGLGWVANFGTRSAGQEAQSEISTKKVDEEEWIWKAADGILRMIIENCWELFGRMISKRGEASMESGSLSIRSWLEWIAIGSVRTTIVIFIYETAIRGFSDSLRHRVCLLDSS
ncbi:hypothetical protein PAPYR_11434 [Paratrimastix pyriformis]|uniref:Uncharacterized protein n=1 Tax=Paratrimastix pyriformis TaxID=342808 RepID=A0ABQ8U9E5_9EUKA|nr:hypothetical protein PAPYR_11434 [Paratrimastix pyriformis]